ncbi:hypothetical protein [Paenibacillus elgii]|uniref:hypothetical protein n=1 Tax=Paenibacillus elgii TaxID=189691 RepID=UPI00203EDA0D|nr:hypothetical protein [Paenibacillus elgii]MCM3269887.1 hypothetical protein [Paenibacillus elgii]
MSVSLALIPVALTLRLVMGKNNFKNWIESMQERIPTSFLDESELVQTVRKAGYDAERWAGNIKTHIDGKNLYIFWELRAGRWEAIFGKSDSSHVINKFMEDINTAAGRQVMGHKLYAQVPTSIAPPLPQSQVESTPVAVSTIFPTNFRDGELLFRTLKEFGINPIRIGTAISCKVEQSTLTFQQAEDGPFHVEIQNAPDLQKMFEYLSDLDEDYKRCVQAVVYEKLRNRIAEKNMTIESEEVLEDNSIVVTLNIGR